PGPDGDSGAAQAAGPPAPAGPGAAGSGADAAHGPGRPGSAVGPDAASARADADAPGRGDARRRRARLRAAVAGAGALAIVGGVAAWLVADRADKADEGGHDRTRPPASASAPARSGTSGAMPTPDAWRWRPYSESRLDAEISVPASYRREPVTSEAELAQDKAITFEERGNPSWIELKRADAETGTPVAWAGRELTWLKDGGARGGSFTAANAKGTVVPTNLDGMDAALLDVTYDAQEGDTGRTVRRMALYVLTDQDERFTVLVEMPKGGKEEAEGIDLFKGVRERVKLGKVATGTSDAATSP
ncbi:hypothetical protein ACWGI8_03710, partial [Streptomyces sp. NPDC054841]